MTVALACFNNIRMPGSIDFACHAASDVFAFMDKKFHPYFLKKLSENCTIMHYRNS